MATNYIGNLLTNIQEYLSSLLKKVYDWLKDILDIVVGKITGMVNSILSSIKAVVTTLRSFIDEITSEVMSGLSHVISQFSDFVDKITSQLITRIMSVLQTVSDAVKNIISGTIDYIHNLITTATGWFASAFDKVVSSILSTAQQVVEFLGNIFVRVKDAIGQIVVSVQQYFVNIVDQVSSAIGTVIDSAGQVVRSIKNAIETFISSVVDVVGSSLRDLLETIASLPDALTRLADTMAESAKENIGKPLLGLSSDMWSEWSKHWETTTAEDHHRIASVMSETYLSGASPPKNHDELRSVFNALTPESGIMRGLYLTIFGALAGVISILGISQAASQVMVQEFALTSPYALLQPGDAVRAKHFGLLDQSATEMILRRNGHSEGDARTLIDIGEQIPPAGEVINWWLRGLIDDAGLSQSLTSEGWSSTSIAHIKKAAFFIPPVQDLITMAVREVFTPAIAEKFGQFQSFPEGFGEQAAKQGISKEWAQNYWAAHWALPSLQMGYEMLHRRVITLEELNVLLRAQDVMPYWRDKLTQISFNPLTRVDVRRMHKLDVLNRQQVHDAYLDIGYDDSNAELLTQFTEQLNKPTGSDNPDLITQLSRNTTVSFYTDGVLTRDVALGLLIDAGNSETGANLYLDVADMDVERQTRQDETTLILEQAKAGILTFDQAQDQFAQAGLGSGELSLAVAKLTREETRRTKLPTKGDLDKFVKHRIIGKDEYISEMQRLGYSAMWSQRFLQLTQAG